MKKLLSILVIAATATAVWFFTKRETTAMVSTADPSIGEITLPALPRGRVLYVVVDSDGAYLGTQRIEMRFAKDAITTLLKEQKIRNLVIYATELARYGDVIEIYAGIEPTLISWSTFSFRSVPVGSRKPLMGYLEPRCCHSVDIENDDEEE